MKTSVLIVTELSANHNLNLQVAMDTIHAVEEAGADVIKDLKYKADITTSYNLSKYFGDNVVFTFED